MPRSIFNSSLKALIESAIKDRATKRYFITFEMPSLIRYTSFCDTVESKSEKEAIKKLYDKWPVSKIVNVAVF